MKGKKSRPVVRDLNDAVAMLAYLGHRTHDADGHILPAAEKVARTLIGQRHHAMMPSMIASALAVARARESHA